MKHLFFLILPILILTACTTPPIESPTPAPALTQPPTSIPTNAPSATAEISVPTIIPTVTVVPTQETLAIRVSQVNGMPQAYIPEGTLHMGGYDARAAKDEFPAHDVKIDAFWIDQLEVTNAMYQLCVNAGACRPPQSIRSARRDAYYNNIEFKDYPVVYVTWEQAMTYCTWTGGRLPTEAEWERAARGDDLRTFPWGEDKPDERFANFNMLVTDTSRAGSYPLGASPFGVLDMAGNVAEWTNDIYGPTFYASAEAMLNPVGPVSSSSLMRVVRGGSLGDAEINIRVSKRSSVLGSNINSLPTTTEFLGDFSPRIGFRCVTEE